MEVKLTAAFLLLAAVLLVAGCKGTPPASTPPLVVQNQTPALPSVSVVYINDSSCELCQGPASIVASLQNSGVKVGTVIVTNYNTTTGTGLINTYNISRVPAALISSDITQYSGIGQNFLQAGAPIAGFYTLLSPPVYRELQNKTLRGLVNLTVITDKTCTECFSPAVFGDAFRSLGLIPAHASLVDVSSTAGKALAAKYNITKVPAALLTGDVVVYGTLRNTWPQLGTVESDGNYVFRIYKPLGAGITYKDLVSGQVINQT